MAVVHVDSTPGEGFTFTVEREDDAGEPVPP